MPITEATIRAAKLYPERLPEAVIRNMAASAESASILDLRRLAPKMLQLDTLGTGQDANVLLRVRADGIQRYDNPTVALPGLAIPALYTMTAKSYLFLTLFGTAITTNHPLWCSLWVWEPTVADKLKYGIKLTPEDERIDRALGIRNSVEKGILPKPFSYIIERHFQVINEETLSWRGTAAAGVDTDVARLVPGEGEFLVIRTLTSASPAVGNNVHIVIDRDDDDGYIDLLAFPLALNYELPCFIPALKEFRIYLTAGIATAGFDVRFSFLRCKMTNIIRARYRLALREELPEPSLWDKVWGGVE